MKKNAPMIAVKSRKTCLEKYGVEYYGQTAEARKAQSERTHGNLDVFLAKTRATMQKRYGVNYSWESAALCNKAYSTMQKRYGTSCYCQSDDYRENLDSIMDKVRNTNMSRYGAPFYVQSDEYKQNVDDIQSRIIATKRQNGVLNTSTVEKHVKGFDDFESQYNNDSRYPYLCDFYDKDRDLFIEVNASWTHGYHWYDAENDVDTCKKWKVKSKKSEYYANALEVFTKRDVEKRECARVNNLNYVTLWDNDGMDADLWFAMGMSIGKDWEREYSWLPYHYIPEDVDVSNMRLCWCSFDESFFKIILDNRCNSMLYYVLKHLEKGFYFECFNYCRKAVTGSQLCCSIRWSKGHL